jgi:transcriptional regulator with XRE-family HTH domain
MYSLTVGCPLSLSKDSRMLLPGLRLRHAREKLGLTYRDVEKASYQLALRRGRPQFILHISRLADIENHGAVPSLYKLYALGVIYHLKPAEIANWYEVPLDNYFSDATSFPAPKTHLFPHGTEADGAVSPSFDMQQTEFLSAVAVRMMDFQNLLGGANGRYRYGFIGLSDRRMAPILRPGSIVMVDASIRRIENTRWNSEYDRPMYFIETHNGYRCGWLLQQKSRIIMQPHPLSRCLPESWRMPTEAEVVGKIAGIVSRLSGPCDNHLEEAATRREGSTGRAV